MSHNNNNREDAEEEKGEAAALMPHPPPEADPEAPRRPLTRSIFPVSAVSPAAERIRFILGEDDDGPPPPQLFTELDELLSVDGQEMEWKETAR